MFVVALSRSARSEPGRQGRAWKWHGMARYAGPVSLASSGLALGLHITPTDGLLLLYILWDPVPRNPSFLPSFEMTRVGNLRALMADQYLVREILR